MGAIHCRGADNRAVRAGAYMPATLHVAVCYKGHTQTLNLWLPVGLWPPYNQSMFA